MTLLSSCFAAEPREWCVFTAVAPEHAWQGCCRGAVHPGPQCRQLCSPGGPRKAPVSHYCFRCCPWEIQTR